MKKALIWGLGVVAGSLAGMFDALFWPNGLLGPDLEEGLQALTVEVIAAVCGATIGGVAGLLAGPMFPRKASAVWAVMVLGGAVALPLAYNHLALFLLRSG